MKNCGCSKNLLTFPKDITKLNFIKDWINWAEPVITDLNTRVPALEEWKDAADADIEYIKNDLDNLTAIEFDGGPIKAKVETVPGGTTAKISMFVFENGYHDEAQITLANISNLKRALNNPDSEPTEDSDNLITSGAVYEALQDIPISSGDNIVSENGTGILATNGALNISLKDGSTTKSITVNTSNADNLNNALNSPDTVPASGSSRLITSGGVYYALSQIEPSTTSIPIVYRVLDDSVMNPPTIEIDSLFPVGGSNRVTLIIRNATSSARDVIDLNNGYLYSDSGYPVHMAQPFNAAQTSENTIPEGGYMILNLYKIDLATFKDEGAETLGSQYAYHSVDHGSDSNLPTCYFITLGGVFEPVA